MIYYWLGAISPLADVVAIGREEKILQAALLKPPQINLQFLALPRSTSSFP
jgi:hypothetical protein